MIPDPSLYRPRPDSNQERVRAYLANEDVEIEVAERVIASLQATIKQHQMALDVRKAQRSAFIERFCLPETPEIPATAEPL